MPNIKYYFGRDSNYWITSNYNNGFRRNNYATTKDSELQRKANKLFTAYRKNSNRFIVGSDYALFNKKIDGFEQGERIYKCFGYVNRLNGIDIDSVVMKQVGGEDSTIFSLTRDDCEMLKINYEQGLCLFPSNMNWELPSYEKEQLKKEIEERDEKIKKQREEEKKRQEEIKKQQEELKRTAEEDIAKFRARNLSRVLLSQTVYRKYIE